MTRIFLRKLEACHASSPYTAVLRNALPPERLHVLHLHELCDCDCAGQVNCSIHGGQNAYAWMSLVRAVLTLLFYMSWKSQPIGQSCQTKLISMTVLLHLPQMYSAHTSAQQTAVVWYSHSIQTCFTLFSQAMMSHSPVIPHAYLSRHLLLDHLVRAAQNLLC